MIQWAAFYSDCEHEVEEVIAGHRITLTYNLYVHEQLGGIFRNPSPVYNDSFTLYGSAKEALSNPDFFPKGRLDFLFALSFAYMDWQGGPSASIVSMRMPTRTVKLCAHYPLLLKALTLLSSQSLPTWEFQ